MWPRVLVDDGAGEGEAEAGSAGVVAFLFADAAEGLEEAGEVFVGHAGALVFYGDFDLGVGRALGDQGDSRVAGGVFDRVVHEIGEHALEQVGVAEHAREGRPFHRHAAGFDL
jgi:hypothetical protein